MAEAGTYRVQVDSEKNRMYLELKGHFSEAQIQTVVDDVIAGVGQLRPGFAVVNDLASFKPASSKGAEDFKQAQAFVARQSVGRIISVTHAQASNGKSFGRSPAFGETATSIAEAEAMLERA